MEIISTSLEEVKLIVPDVYRDDRGFFFESHNVERFAEHGLDQTFVQDNVSSSSRGVLRGMHFQAENCQGKLVQVLHGRIFDVAVDIRPKSLTFGQWYGTELSAENQHQLFIPVGFAHGFVSLDETNVVMYKCTDKYNPYAEHTLAWDDPSVNINWPEIDRPTLSEKDQSGKSLKMIANLTETCFH